jgi:S1-C subfamily serine protease
MPLDMFINPADLAGANQAHDQAILAKLQPYLVKVRGFDTDDKLVSEGSGFLYGEHGYIMTAGHVLGAASRYQGTFIDGSTQPLKVHAHSEDRFDVGILCGPISGAILHARGRLRAGETAYVLGFGPGSTNVSFSKGVVSAGGISSVTIAVHADHCWSGGAIVDVYGKLAGMVQGYECAHMTPVTVVDAFMLDVFATRHNAPGLSE